MRFSNKKFHISIFIGRVFLQIILENSVSIIFGQRLRLRLGQLNVDFRSTDILLLFLKLPEHVGKMIGHHVMIFNLLFLDVADSMCERGYLLMPATSSL